MKSSKLYTKKNKKTHVTKNKSIKKTNKVYKKKTKRIKKKQKKKYTKKGGANSVNNTNTSKIDKLIQKLTKREYLYSELLKYTNSIKTQILELIKNLKKKQEERGLNQLVSKLLKLYEEKCNEINMLIGELLRIFNNNYPLQKNSYLEKQIKELLKLIIKYKPAVEKILRIEILLFQIPTRIELLIKEKFNNQKEINEMFPEEEEEILVLKNKIIEEIDKRLERLEEAKEEKEYLQKIKEKLFDTYDIETIETQLEIAQTINSEVNAYLEKEGKGKTPPIDYKTGLFKRGSRRRLSEQIKMNSNNSNNTDRGYLGTQYAIDPFVIQELPVVEV